jgi:hypothetical protein
LFKCKALYVNKTSGPYNETFIKNVNFYQEFPCLNDPTTTCATVIQDTKGVQLLFYNGLSISLQISKVPLNSIQSISWITSSIALSDNIFDYKGKVYGLMGNNNGDDTDDIVSRTGVSVQGDSQRAIYSIASTCKFCLKY